MRRFGHHTTRHSINTLAGTPAGRCKKVQKLFGGKEFISRMTALGFSEGAVVEVLQNYGHGPLIALVRGVRVGLGRGEALKVLVEEVDV